MKKLLDLIKKPNDIKKIPESKYEILAEEIREFLISSVSATGGHLASNLGTVELTMALHTVMNLPEDKIVWDVGHQSYTHKILTGRKERFKNLRQFDGLSGFPKRCESACDSFDTGHSSTSISAALGYATADKLNKKNSKIVAVIGDGALTGGMALEALNNVAAVKRNFVIILNDNNMSISENVGSMSNYLSKLRVGSYYNDLKVDVVNSLNKIPKVGKRLVEKVKNTKNHLKNLIVPSSFFDDLGITYIGPVDGHNTEELIDILDDAFNIDHPILIHIRTIKGKGYKYAEDNPSKFHGINIFDKDTGIETSTNGVMSYTDVFSKNIVKMAKTNEKIVAITAAMPDGTGLSRFQEAYPDRFFDVGIAEEHAVTFAAGLAAAGFKPFVSIYSSFYQRAYDQILHDVCLQNLPVTFIIDRAGIVGPDGDTHQGIFDMSFMSSIPNMTIIAPKNIRELTNAMKFAENYNGPVAIRFSKGIAYTGYDDSSDKLEYGKSEILKKGNKTAIIAIGNMVEEASKALDLLSKEDVYPTLINSRFIKPIDYSMVRNIAEEHSNIIVVEEGIKRGGYGAAIEGFILEETLDVKVCVMAIDDQFVKQGSIQELREYIGIDYKSIYKKVLELEK